jgi:hydroxymethylpyrimidine pyrophosphatase-like HAD family hydrolase
MEKLLEVVKVLMTLGTQIQFLIDQHKTITENGAYINHVKFKDPHHASIALDKAISGSLQNYLKIIACSFLDEYQEELAPNKHPEFDQRIKRLKTITKPVIKRINQWKDLREYRNVLLAHNLRVKGKSLYSKDISHIHYNVPHTNKEHELLGELLIILMSTFAQEFSDVFALLDYSENLKSKLRFDYSVIDVQAEKEKIWTEVNEIRSKMLK